ncbi:MAG: hypothetical protein ACOYVD_12830 [Bacillota bacterium]
MMIITSNQIDLHNNSKLNWGFNEIPKINSKFFDFHLPHSTLGHLVDVEYLDWQDYGNSIIKNKIYDIDLLERIYSFTAPEDIRNFLETNDFLIPVLFENFVNAKLYFRKYERLTISKINDPDMQSQEKLVVKILLECEPEEALDYLKQLKIFDEEWWLKKIHLTKSKLCIDLEFV